MPYLDVSVSPRASGTVTEIFVKEGDWIQVGDTLAVMDDAKEQLDMELSEHEIDELRVSLDKLKKGRQPKELEKMQVDLKKAKLSEEKAKAELDRVERLFEQKAVSEKEVADAKNAHQTAALSVESLRLGLEIAASEPRKEDVILQEMKIAQKMTGRDQKTLALEKLTLISPAAGAITKLYYAPGEYAGAGSPFCDVIYTDSLYVELNLPLSEIRRIERGMRAEVTVPAITPKTYAGKVVFIGPTVDPASRTFKIRILIDNPKHVLRPGLFATVKL
ncbi:efflux RND transporter periplasmic adaptor subunit [bacterium]|nr:efflux RND transporter periplasmic adaptor subunit [bacterium]